MIGSIKVVNCKNFDKENCNGEVIDIMYPNILCNPFKMINENEREIVVRKFYHYLREEFIKKDNIFNELNRIKEIVESGKDIYLMCCCYPMLCHGNIIKNAIMGMIEYEQRKK